MAATRGGRKRIKRIPETPGTLFSAIVRIYQGGVFPITMAFTRVRAVDRERDWTDGKLRKSNSFR